jgi:hypothetical protein
MSIPVSGVPFFPGTFPISKLACGTQSTHQLFLKQRRRRNRHAQQNYQHGHVTSNHFLAGEHTITVNPKLDFAHPA